jgi:hypothetical protein
MKTKFMEQNKKPFNIVLAESTDSGTDYFIKLMNNIERIGIKNIKVYPCKNQSQLYAFLTESKNNQEEVIPINCLVTRLHWNLSGFNTNISKGYIDPVLKRIKKNYPNLEVLIWAKDTQYFNEIKQKCGYECFKAYDEKDEQRLIEYISQL